MSQINDLGARALDKAASGWRRLKSAIPQLMFQHFVDTNCDYHRTILLAGSGRGGTTWLAEVINYDNSLRFMFEPFNHARVPMAQRFGECQYLRPNESNPEFLKASTTILSGRIRNRWVDAYNRRLKVDRRLIKDIRINLMLGWIKAKFPAIPMVLLLRHPLAVAHSRSREGWIADVDGTFLSQRALVNDHLSPFVSVLQDLTTDFERHVFSWCVETYVPLKQLTPADIFITTYENCVTDPEAEISKLFEYLKRPFGNEVLKAASKPSSQTRRNIYSGNASPIVSGGRIVDAWQQTVAPDDVERGIKILKLFGLDEIYGYDSLPNSQALKKISARK